jgi:hypothetical protein
MKALFAIVEEAIHHVGDPQCPECLEDYPEPCRCGGLLHAESGEEQDPDGELLPVTKCDQCGRSEDQLDEM